MVHLHPLLAVELVHLLLLLLLLHSWDLVLVHKLWLGKPRRARNVRKLLDSRERPHHHLLLRGLLLLSEVLLKHLLRVLSLHHVLLRLALHHILLLRHLRLARNHSIHLGRLEILLALRHALLRLHTH